MCNGYDLVYRWFDFLKEKYSIKVYARLNDHSGRAYEIIKRLEENCFIKILLRLKEGLTQRDVAKGQKHKVFEDSFDAKPIYHRAFLLQKINYIQLNCVRGKWKLVEHWEDYEFSSTRFYVKNKLDRFVPVHYEELS